ncbi:hypothetical protein [Antarcticimicrobium luteum]|uniref:hypothetical protein n=1 Tax=Antarcticimicrobium luteum TaxID=2547397 RepID=UPI00140D7F74|nr:hypothetical protein [Antarcticimicrobium luteum]
MTAIYGGVSMQGAALLEQIWGDEIEVRAPDEMSPLARLLGALLTAPMVTLVTHTEGGQPYAMMEADELLPGAPLGDILTEELGLDVPHDAVVLIEPACFADADSYSGNVLGRELGRILSEIATCAGACDVAGAAHGAVWSAGGDIPRSARRALSRDMARILPEVDRAAHADGARLR